MNNIQILLFGFLTTKTIIQIIHPQNYQVLILQWFLMMVIQQIFDLLSIFNSIYWICLIAQTALTLMKFKNLSQFAIYFQSIQFDKFLTEIKYQFSFVLVTTTSKLMKVIFVKILQSIDTQELSDERQSKLQQQLLDVSQFIEMETQNRCNKTQINQSQIVDQTLNLNYTIIEKSDDLPSQQNRESLEILKELELNTTAKKENQFESAKPQINVQPIAQQVQVKKSPQEQLKQSIPTQNIIQKSTSPKQNNSQRSSSDLNSLKKTLDLLQKDQQISARLVVETIQERVQESKIAKNMTPQKLELFQKMERCKEKILQQQKQNSNFYE